MRGSRLLSTLLILQLRGRVTAEALAAEFEVSVRTVYRDIDELSAAGIPVYGDRGPGGGFQLLDGYRTRLTGLAADEAEAMLMIGLPGPAAALGLGGAALRAQRKLLASLPGTGGEEAGRMGQRFLLDPLDWYRAGEAAPHLPALARAVLDQRRVAIRYESWSGVRDWTVAPLGLVLKAGAWYVVAEGGAAIRIFKVSNCLTLTVEETRFERPAEFDLHRFWPAELARFEAGLRPERAHLRASAEGLKRLAKLGAYAAEAVQATSPPDDAGWAALTLPFENIEQAALALLGLGPEVEVLEPAALRAQLGTLAGEVVARARPIARPKRRSGSAGRP
jgi:predicted DNA-binding transcriptional regulator YafY